MISDNSSQHITPPETITSAYLAQIRQKLLVLSLLLGAVVFLAVFSIVRGAYHILVKDILCTLTGNADPATSVVITNIRMPRIAAAILCGWGLSLSGLCIQTLLRNPLGSPITLGISHGAAFGASAAIVIFGAGIVSVTASAFAGGISATLVILILAKLKRLSPAAIILAGVAMHSLFLSGTCLIQYIATETELAQVVFWTFGDVARSSWGEIFFLSGAVLLITIFLMRLRWDLNAFSLGDETAKGLGVSVTSIRLTGMAIATLVAAMATSFHGIIGFLGLIAPHIARRLAGEDHFLLILFSAVLGALLLLAADTVGRLLIGSGSLPVGVITSFLGAPLFLYFLVKEFR
ncbi:MAG: iron ABC transporter permease [Thermodesulfobacteriota bacterium]|nr:iron ABC transporter permease [Thermodesulfobacteriota bacterium]